MKSTKTIEINGLKDKKCNKPEKKDKIGKHFPVFHTVLNNLMLFLCIGDLRLF
jgi:hypothetical protein